jgi:hypothetical protein
MRIHAASPLDFARSSRQRRETNLFSAFARAVSRMKGRGNVHANLPVAMRNSGSTNGSGSGRGASTTNHPIVARALESIGIIARVTRVRGSRGLVLAEKSGAGWVRRAAGRGRQAFTRMELCACLAAGALLVLLALPALATSQSRGHVAQCLNNLRLAGRAVQMWASDYNSMMPPWRTPEAEGGTMPVIGPKNSAAWFEFLYLSNQLATPRILACPADEGVRIAGSFAELVPHPYRDNSVSYFINLHTSLDRPETALFGDRNLSFGAVATTCSLAGGINTVKLFTTATVWTNALHGPSGNIVTMDGRVAQTSTNQMQTALLRSQAEGPNVVHLLKPR